MKRIIEICCTSIEDVIAARKGGATRIELCQGISAGGLTPSLALTRAAIRERGHMAVNVLIRPREGDFVYTQSELDTIQEDITAAKEAGADGVVIGALTPDGDIDIEAMKQLLMHCEGMSVTFHRAFDVVRDHSLALEQIINLGIDRILTSGAEPSAPQGADLIADLVRQARNRIIIMPGAGISPANITDLQNKTQAVEFHSTATDKSTPPPADSPLFGPKPRPTSANIVKALLL